MFLGFIINSGFKYLILYFMYMYLTEYTQSIFTVFFVFEILEGYSGLQTCQLHPGSVYAIIQLLFQPFDAWLRAPPPTY